MSMGHAVLQSVAEFWGMRWNRTANDVLRWVVYQPVVTGESG